MASKPRVLIVDDEPVVRDALAMALSEDQWEVEVVDSAEAALERGGEQWAVFIVDKNLPKMSGLDFIRTVREKDQIVGIIMVTGFSSVQTALDTLHLGVDGYLEKPFEDIFAVVRTVGETVEKRDKRNRAGSMAGAVSHFARATAHLKAVKPVGEDRQLQALTAMGKPDEAEWIEQRLGACVVSRVSNGEELTQSLQNGAPDLVFVDALGEELTECIAEIRRLAPLTECVVVTPRPSLNTVTRLIELGVRAVLEKPLTDKQFDQRILGIIERLGANRRAG